MSVPLARTYWNIPYQRNPFFTGREDILSRLDCALHAEQSVALSQPQGISGLVGIGKTQAMVEYVYHHQKEYDAVLWVRADSVTSLTSGMVNLERVQEGLESHITLMSSCGSTDSASKKRPHCPSHGDRQIAVCNSRSR